MDHDVRLISTVAAGFGLALVFGVVAERCRLPALVGYLLAGIAMLIVLERLKPLWSQRLTE